MSDVSRFQFLTEKYITTRLITQSGLLDIIAADPTSRFDEAGSLLKVGKYTQWILRLYEKCIGQKEPHLVFNTDMEVWFENLYKIHDDLMVYEAVKEKKFSLPPEKKDINQVASAHELYTLVRSFAKEVTLSKTEVKTMVFDRDIEVFYDGVDWDVIVPTTAKAATLYSGPPLTRWCTAASGNNNLFERYHRQGKLYILRDKRQIVSEGRGMGHPRPLYQFHFESGSFMDVDDVRVDLVDLVGTTELKEPFKPLLKKYWLNSKVIQVRFPTDNTSKYIQLYGFEDFFEMLPEDLTDLDVDYSGGSLAYAVPPSIKKFTQLKTIYLQYCVSQLPEEIGELTNLECLSVPNNRHLKALPQSVGRLPNLFTLNIVGTNIQIPDDIRALEKAQKIWIVR